MEAPVVLVTGAARGIGLETVRGLAARGARAVLAARDGERAAAAARQAGAAFSIALDITDDDSVRRAAEAIGAKFGRLDVLINNAAILLDHYAGIETTGPEVLRRTLETNVVGTLRVTLGFLDLLRKSTAPRILTVSSGAGQLDGPPQAFAPAYS
ncbi:MAG: SDR family NAD(P)-dependent oxidoreductase, partial [Terrimicrobiaceae bacterium]|nr:SDR family NAD(P)-dependent oxidoreductase [Terrimicrobiaceae bacterium]